MAFCNYINMQYLKDTMIIMFLDTYLVICSMPGSSGISNKLSINWDSSSFSYYRKIFVAFTITASTIRTKHYNMHCQKSCYTTALYGTDLKCELVDFGITESSSKTLCYDHAQPPDSGQGGV